MPIAVANTASDAAPNDLEGHDPRDLACGIAARNIDLAAGFLASLPPGVVDAHLAYVAECTAARAQQRQRPEAPEPAPIPDVPAAVLDLFAQGAVLTRQRHDEAPRDQPIEGSRVAAVSASAHGGITDGAWIERTAATRWEIEGILLSWTADLATDPDQLAEWIDGDGGGYPQTAEQAADTIRRWTMASVVLVRVAEL